MCDRDCRLFDCVRRILARNYLGQTPSTGRESGLTAHRTRLRESASPNANVIRRRTGEAPVWTPRGACPCDKGLTVLAQPPQKSPKKR